MKDSAQRQDDDERIPMHSYWNDLLLTLNCLLCVPMYSMSLWMTVYCLAVYYAPNVWTRTLLLLYVPYCILDKRPTTTGGRSYEWTERFRSVWFYQGVAKYFPVHLHKTVDLDPTKSYIFLYHPHGVIGMGANTALSTNGCHFQTVFPGIRRYGVTLNVSFWAPIFREWMLALGYISANKETLVHTLRDSSVVLVPGGAAEALHAHRSNFRLHILHRRGFVRLAMETNAVPIPCLGFGENEAFETYYNPEATYSSLLYWQQKLYKLMSFSLPILTSIVPNRRPIHVVVGEPVEFKGKTVEECHKEYLDAVRRLYNEHKAKYGYDDIELELV